MAIVTGWLMALAVTSICGAVLFRIFVRPVLVMFFGGLRTHRVPHNRDVGNSFKRLAAQRARVVELGANAYAERQAREAASEERLGKGAG